MRKSWRPFIVVALAGLWPQLGCHQLPADKSVQDLKPIQKKDSVTAKQLTAEEVGKSLVAQAKALEDAKKPGEAVAMYEKIRTSDPLQAPHASKRIAFIYLCANEFDRAEQEYQAIVQRNPRDFDAIYSLGDIAYRRGHFGTAEKFFRDVVAKKPDHQAARINLGMTLVQTGDHAGSLENFKKAGFSDSDAYCEIGFILKVNGKREEAMAAYQQALNFDAKCERAKSEMSQLYRQDPDLPMRMQMPSKGGKIGSVHLEPSPLQPVEGFDRVMMPRPTLPAMPEVDIPMPNWSAEKKR